MQRNRVVSSNLKSVGYENNILEIEFKTGSVYQYFGVPESIYLGLMNASSKGTYHDRFIKNRFRFKKIK